MYTKIKELGEVKAEHVKDREFELELEGVEFLQRYERELREVMENRITKNMFTRRNSNDEIQSRR